MPRLYRSIQIIAILFAAVLLVSPVLGTTFLGDDAFNSYLDGWMANHNSNSLTAFLMEMREWDVGRGRFVPVLQILNVAQFHLTHDARPLKIVQAMLTGANIISMFLLLLEVTRNHSRAVAGTGVAMLTLQIRYGFDAIVQYNLHLPITTEFSLLSALFFIRGRRYKKRRDVFAAVAFFSLAVLTYEITALLAFGFMAIIVSERGSFRRFVAAVPFVVALTLEALVVAIIRHYSPQATGSAYAPSIISPAFVSTALAQILSTVPFVYEIVDPQKMFTTRAADVWLRPPPFAIGAAIAALIAFLITSDDRGDFPRRDPAACTSFVTLALASSFLVGPALLVAASPFYQNVIYLGTPYIPVYFQGFGFGMAAAALDWDAIGLSLERLRVPGVPLGGILLAIGILIVGESNAIAVTHFGAWTFPRQTIVDGLKRGAAAGVRGDASLYLDHSYIVNERFEAESFWNSRYFYRVWSGLRLRTFTIDKESSMRFVDAYELRSLANDADHGVLLVQHVRRTSDGKTMLVDAHIYERGGTVRSRRPQFVASHFAARDFTLLRSGSGWVMYAFRPLCIPLPPASLVDDSPARGTLIYDQGFSAEESEHGERFRWAGSKAKLIVRNDSDKPEHANLVARVGTVVKGSGTLVILNRGSIAHVPLIVGGRSITIPLEIEPRHSISLMFSSPGATVALPGNNRNLRFRLLSPSLIDTDGCAMSG